MVCPRSSLECEVMRGYAVGGPPDVDHFSFSVSIAIRVIIEGNGNTGWYVETKKPIGEGGGRKRA